MPKVSICVPVYNVEKYIRRCIESLVNQTLRDIEIIIVNDSTQDNSMLIVSEYAPNDDRIVIISHDCNHGAMMARQSGYKAAIGQYITFCDGDDWLPLDSVERLYKKAVSSSADIVCGDIQMVDEKNQARKILKTRIKGSYNRVESFRAILNRSCTQNLCSKLFRRELLQNYDHIALEHCNNAEDAGALFQFVDYIEAMVSIDEVVYNYYVNNNSSSSVRLKINNIESMCKNSRIRLDIINCYPELKELSNEYFTRNLHVFRFSKVGRRLLINNNLEEYITFRYMIKYLKLNHILLLPLRFLLSKSSI